jgi:hypothetical protein
LPTADGGIDAFERARGLFEEKKYGEAALLSRTLALDPSIGAASVYSSSLYLSALSALAHERAACIDLMVLDIPALKKAHCTGTPVGRAIDECKILARIDTDVRMMQADHSGNAEPYLAIFQPYCVDAVLLRNCDEVLYNAAIIYARGNQMDRARAVLKMMQDPTNKVAASKLTIELACRLGPDAGACR